MIDRLAAAVVFVFTSAWIVTVGFGGLLCLAGQNADVSTSWIAFLLSWWYVKWLIRED